MIDRPPTPPSSNAIALYNHLTSAIASKPIAPSNKIYNLKGQLTDIL
ncbi:MAG: hypothetical protein F6K09_02590 [Merismopedia sp. SIO2A8]|nr:hypothetical protein [Merismopedia sp. SIO2A8]